MPVPKMRNDCSTNNGLVNWPVHNLLMQFFTLGSSKIEVFETCFFDVVTTNNDHPRFKGPPLNKKEKNKHDTTRPPQGLPAGGRGQRGDGDEGQDGVGVGTRRQTQCQRAGGQNVLNLAGQAKRKHAQLQPELGPETVAHCACAGKGRGRERGTVGTDGVLEQAGRRGKWENEGGWRKGRRQHSGRGWSGRKVPTGDPGEGPSLKG